MNKLWLICCFCLPLRQLQITSGYGYRIHPVTGHYNFHYGVDFRARSDTVFSVLDGKVTSTGYDPFLGLFVRLDHYDFQTGYGHLSQVFVLQGDSVTAGEAIAITGATGRVTGEHLHFSVQFHNAYINPIKFLLLLKNQIHQK